MIVYKAGYSRKWMEVGFVVKESDKTYTVKELWSDGQLGSERRWNKSECFHDIDSAQAGLDRINKANIESKERQLQYAAEEAVEASKWHVEERKRVYPK